MVLYTFSNYSNIECMYMSLYSALQPFLLFTIKEICVSNTTEKLHTLWDNENDQSVPSYLKGSSLRTSTFWEVSHKSNHVFCSPLWNNSERISQCSTVFLILNVQFAFDSPHITRGHFTGILYNKSTAGIWCDSISRVIFFIHVILIVAAFCVALKKHGTEQKKIVNECCCWVI